MQDAITEKVCTQCGELRSVSLFTKDAGYNCGYQSVCHICKRMRHYENRESEKKRMHERYLVNKEDHLAKGRAYREKNRERILAQRAEYRKTPTAKRVKREWEAAQTRKNPWRRIHKSLSRRIAIALLKQNNRKTNKTQDYIGCTIAQLRQYLELKFDQFMNWDNYGEWHIDHIIPCVKFDLSEEAQIKKCFHYSNLQPLWAEDNLRKGSQVA